MRKKVEDKIGEVWGGGRIVNDIEICNQVKMK